MAGSDIVEVLQEVGMHPKCGERPLARGMVAILVRAICSMPWPREKKAQEAFRDPSRSASQWSKTTSSSCTPGHASYISGTVLAVARAVASGVPDCPNTIACHAELGRLAQYHGQYLYGQAGREIQYKVTRFETGRLRAAQEARPPGG